MPDRPDGIVSAGLNEAVLELLVQEHESSVLPRLERMWAYFRNPLEPIGVTGLEHGASSGRWYRAAQEMGLPSRIVGRRSSPKLDDRSTGRREVVVENDIAWRVQAMVDFLFGKPLQLVSGAAREATRDEIERVLEAVWEASGGVGMLQDAGLLGHVFGHVDFAVRIDEARLLEGVGAGGDVAVLAAESIRVEPIDPRRGLAMLSPDDYRVLDGYVVRFEREMNEAVRGGVEGSGARRLFGRDRAKAARERQLTELHTRLMLERQETEVLLNALNDNTRVLAALEASQRGLIGVLSRVMVRGGGEAA